MRKLRRRKLILWIAIPIAIVLIGIAIYRFPPQREAGPDTRPTQKTEAPPDLAKLRDRFAAGLDALRHNDAAAAAEQLGGFTFGGRAVEEYRLYYLAKAHTLAKRDDLARATLSKLMSRTPRMVAADDAGATLAAIYADHGDWLHASRTHATAAARSDAPNNAAAARWAAVETRFNRGDLAGALYAARSVVIKNAASPQSAAALAFIRSITPNVAFTPAERLERAVGLMRDNNLQSAFDELTALEPQAPASIKDAVRLNRGLALYQLHRYEDATKALDPLASGQFTYAIPAIYHASKSYRALANSINPMVSKTIVEKKKVGTVKVRRGKGKKARTITKPKFANVKKTIQLVDLAKKAKKETYDRLATERLKDLLQIRGVAPDVRLEVLNSLVAMAEQKNQDAYAQQLVAEIVKLDPYADPALQHFWDKAWAAYARGDLATAKTLFQFIAGTYAAPNVKRQSDYWYARSIERGGQKAEAAAIYQRLAAAPYEDLYATYAESRGAKRTVANTNPLKAVREDWSDIAEKQMPAELRLAYELTALGDSKDAQAEIQKNATRANGKFADALLADLYNSAGGLDPMYRALRRAFPTLATVEQDSVPPYFLKMYYPIRYEDSIKKHAQKNSLDPFVVMALILQESYFNPRARSRVGAIGLMQLMPPTGLEIGRQLHGRFSVARLDDPSTNIEIGTVHFRRLVTMFGGETRLAIASYNAGQGNVMKWRRAAPKKPMDEFLESIPFPETRNYVKRITLLRSSYARMSN